MYEVIVIGGGPAGLAAATWLGRYRFATLVLDSEQYRNEQVELSHGYLGEDPAHPAGLLESARRDLAKYGSVEYRHGKARAALKRGHGRFGVEVDGEELDARRLILATGVRDEAPEIDGFAEHYGADVFHCPACDGYEAKGRDVAVFGWSEQVPGFAVHLSNWARSVVVVTDGRALEGDDASRDTLARHSIELIEDEAARLLGPRSGLRGVELRSGRVLDCQLGFFSIRHVPVNDLAVQLGCRLTKEDLIEVDDCMRTSVPGIYAAGDVVPGMQLVPVAVGQGTIAGVECALELVAERVSPGDSSDFA